MRVFITGGAGFIGCNVADFHLKRGDSVIVFDNLSRKGAELNLKWLKKNDSRGMLTFVRGDVRNFDELSGAVSSEVDLVYHFAGQVAVTTSITEPRPDFEINALGTFNLLEAVRENAPEAIVLYSSTNKVYGALESQKVVEAETRYDLVDLPNGIDESEGLDFHSPYGCSKGCGDQYVRDYARIYGLRTVVCRQSCIYGTRQFGVEDQGWVAYFCLAAKFGRPITIYGNGKQVRDVLWIGDLVSAYEAIVSNIEKAAGEVYNIGGGPKFTISIWKEFGCMLEKLAGRKIKIAWSDWRPGDQGIYVSDVRKAARDLGWKPSVSVEAGLEKLWAWISDNEVLLRKIF